ncbi:lipopolysaccharide biosynthesis protein [Alicyclobacillus hesperidum]|uniref:lipopolysaccharide biosynthesis protein n=1 Tax=Alicyclobacillus hesperidum TaxID=89784 RepID=UPI00058EB500|nr:oligosaccharide flippase family protein [Alicyclobacillus hesperidum]
MKRYSLRLNSIYNILASAILSAGGFVASVVVSRRLGVIQFGTYQYITFIASTLSLIILQGTNVAIVQDSAKVLNASNDHWVNVTFPVTLRKILAKSSALILIAAGVFAFNKQISISLILAIILTLQSIASALIQGTERFAFYLISTILLESGLVTGFFLAKNVANILLVSVLSYGLVAILSFIVTRSLVNIRAVFNFCVREKMSGFTNKLFLVTVIDTVVWNQFELIFIKYFGSPRDVALYSVAYKLSVAGVLPITAILNSLRPRLNKVLGLKDSNAVHELMGRMVRFSAGAGLIFLFGWVACAPWAIHLVYGLRYMSATLISEILFLGSVMGVVAIPATFLLYGENDADFLLGLAACAGIIDIVGVVVALTVWHNMVGVAFVTTVSQIIPSVSVWIHPRLIPWRLQIIKNVLIYTCLCVGWLLFSTQVPRLEYVYALTSACVGVVVCFGVRRIKYSLMHAWKHVHGGFVRNM